LAPQVTTGMFKAREPPIKQGVVFRHIEQSGQCMKVGDRSRGEGTLRGSYRHRDEVSQDSQQPMTSASSQLTGVSSLGGSFPTVRATESLG